MDYNFFEPYKKIKPKTDVILLVITAIFAFVIVGLLLITLKDYTEVNGLKADIENYESQMAQPAFIEKLKKVDTTDAELKKVKVEASSFKSFDLYSKLIGTVNEDVLNMVSNSMTAHVAINELKINLGTISMDCMALSKKDVANFENNLRTSGYFTDVFIPATDQSTVNIQSESGSVDKETLKKQLNDYPYDFKVTMNLNLAKLYENPNNDKKIEQAISNLIAIVGGA